MEEHVDGEIRRISECCIESHPSLIDGDFAGIVYYSPPRQANFALTLVKYPTNLARGAGDASVKGNLTIACHFAIGDILNDKNYSFTKGRHELLYA